MRCYSAAVVGGGGGASVPSFALLPTGAQTDSRCAPCTQRVGGGGLPGGTDWGPLFWGMGRLSAVPKKICTQQRRWAARRGGRASVTHLRVRSLQLPPRRSEIMQPHALTCKGLQNSKGHHCELRWPIELKWKYRDQI